MKLLVLNAGSGSQRCTLFDLPSTALPEEPLAPLWEGRLDTTDPEQPPGKIRVLVTADGKKTEAALLNEKTPPEERTALLLQLLWTGSQAVLSGPGQITAIGHRVVHGGEQFSAATRIDSTVETAIEKLSALSPLHNPANLSCYRVARRLIPDRSHYAVFDTAFHATLPPEAYFYAGPYHWREQGIRKYGFHGSSFRWASRRAAALLARDGSAGLNLIICHLGGGCSLCAVRDGRSIDTTMGFTPLDGIAMCTRSGALDPGILIYLQRQGMSADELEKLLNKESGIKGLSGQVGDTRVLRALAEKGDARARLALDVFKYRLRAGIGQMLAALAARPDAIVFTDAIGEEGYYIRADVCAQLQFLGVELDQRKNLEPYTDDADLATPASRVRVLLIGSREAWQIATECHPLMSE